MLGTGNFPQIVVLILTQSFYGIIRNLSQCLGCFLGTVCLRSAFWSSSLPELSSSFRKWLIFLFWAVSWSFFLCSVSSFWSNGTLLASLSISGLLIGWFFLFDCLFYLKWCSLPQILCFGTFIFRSFKYPFSTTFLTFFKLKDVVAIITLFILEKTMVSLMDLAKDWQKHWPEQYW